MTVAEPPRSKLAPGPKLLKRPRRRAYRLLALMLLAVSGALAVHYFEATEGAPVRAATQLGRIYGLVSAVLFALLSLYGLRRLYYRQRLGSLELWYRAHLVLGTVALAAAGCHAGFAFRSPFLTLLQIGFWGTVATGIFGWGYQTLLKRWMTRNEFRPTVMTELELAGAQLRRRLARYAAEGGPDHSALEARLLEQAIRGALARMALRRFFHSWRLPGWAFWEREIEAATSGGPLRELPDEPRRLVAELNRSRCCAGTTGCSAGGRPSIYCLPVSACSSSPGTSGWSDSSRVSPRAGGVPVRAIEYRGDDLAPLSPAPAPDVPAA